MRTVKPKMYLLAGVLAILVLALSGCAAPAAPAAPAATARSGAEATATEAAAEEAAAAPAEGEAVKVALVYGVKGDGFYVTMEKGARAKAEELGVDFSADGPAQFDASAAAPDSRRHGRPAALGDLHRRHRQAGLDRAD